MMGSGKGGLWANKYTPCSVCGETILNNLSGIVSHYNEKHEGASGSLGPEAVSRRDAGFDSPPPPPIQEFPGVKFDE